MTDYDKLRELAEAAGPGPWVTAAGVTDDYRAVIAKWHEDEEWITDDGVATFYAEFIAAANPDVILNLLEDLRITRAERDAEKKKNMQAAKDNAADHRARQEVATAARADSWDEGYIDGYFDAKENHHKGPDEALRRTPNPYWKDTK